MSWLGDLTNIRKIAAVSFTVFGLWCVLGVSGVRAQAITEGFTDITTLPAAGWFTQNNSSPVGSTGWFQGNPAVFPADAPPDNSYIGANFNNTTGTNTISNWLLTPNRTFNNGDVIKFWSRTTLDNPFPDRLEVRLSTSGASTNVGTGSAAVGDFTSLLLSINAGLVVGGYPDFWSEFTITLSGLSGPTSGRVGFRYFVTEGGPTGDNSNYIGIDTFSYTPGGGGPVQHVLDFDGDGKTDGAVVRNTGGGPSGQDTWFIRNSSGSPVSSAREWGLNTDFRIPVDYDGDDKTDIAVWRPAAPFASYFYILKSSTGTFDAVQFGQSGDDPTVSADYDNDGKADPAIYRAGAASGDQSFWWFKRSTDGVQVAVPFGRNGDFPSPGDYDGDGFGDFMIQRNGGGGQASFQGCFGNGTSSPCTGNNLEFSTIHGTPTDVILPGDYDGDGKTDICTIRGSGGQIFWFVRPSSTGVSTGAPTYVHGASATDFPTQGDYDGDGKTDAAIWRPNADPTQNFYIVRGSTSGLFQFEWGQNGDYPVANYNAH